MTATLQPRGWMRTVSHPFRVFGDRVLLEPIRDGRLRNTGWPAGLASISGLALLVYAATGAMLVLSPWLRQYMPMFIGTGGVPRPYLGLAMLFGGVSFCVALIQTAALHGHWLLRLAGTMVTIVVVGAMGIALPGSLMPPLVISSGACMVGILVLVIVRSRKSFAWWEFAAVFALVAVACLVPSLLVGRKGALIGTEVRPTIADFNMLLLFSVTIPAMLVAGSALTEIAVSSAHWGLTLLRQGRSARAWVALVVVVVVARAAQIGWSWYHDAEPWRWDGWLMAAVVVGLCLAAAMGLARLARRRTGTTHEVPSPADMLEEWTPVRGVAAAIMFLVLIGLMIVAVTQMVLSAFDVSIDALGPLARAATGGETITVGEGVLSLVAAVMAVAVARRGRLGYALILACLTIAFWSWVLLRVPYVRDWLPAWTAESLGGVAAVVALVLLGWFGLRRTLDDRRVFALVLVFALGITYDLRDILDEPLSWLLGFSGMAVAFFGLLWRVLTDGTFTRGDTARFPVASRVMFFWANALLAVIVLTQIAMGRDTGGSYDQTAYVSAGDLMLGRPFYLAALVACLWAALTPRPRPEPERTPSEPRPDDRG